MMTAEVVQLAPAGRDKHWPLLVPRTILTQYQPVIGVAATLLWLNLYEVAEGGAGAEFVSVQAHVTARMGITPEAVEQVAVTLEQAGLLQRRSGRWTLLWPAAGPDGTAAETAQEPEVGVELDVDGPGIEDAPPVEHAPAVTHATPAADAAVTVAGAEMAGGQTAAAQTAVDNATGWNSDEAALQAVVQFYHQRIGMLGPSQFEKLRFWVEDQGMSSDVVALAIEETVQSAPTPRMAYVEGVLRNWYNEGIRTLAHLQNSRRVRSQEVPPTTEGTPNASSFAAVDRDAVRRWKEMYSDEYDD